MLVAQHAEGAKELPPRGGRSSPRPGLPRRPSVSRGVAAKELSTSDHDASREGPVAQKINIVLIDNLDGTPADETLRFGVDGGHYEIDLSADHARELRERLQEYVRHARTEARPPRPRHDAAMIRAWALQNGFAVAPRGRVHRDVLDAYYRAHP